MKYKPNYLSRQPYKKLKLTELSIVAHESVMDEIYKICLTYKTEWLHPSPR